MQRTNRTLLILGLLALASLPAAAQTQNVQVRNNTDKWAWMTAIGYVSHWYGGSYDNIAAWCVGPNSFMTRGNFSTNVQSMRAEITEKNCAHPVHADLHWTNVPRSATAEVHLTMNGCDPSRWPCYRMTAYKVEPAGKPDKPADKPKCPYSCQSWNPASKSCVGAPSNACK
ncbi:MAG TPA: hypothetical protein VKU62_01885 [Thermoanaerobaculia bacterium]|nr:hypothetical protein [Thermoanaerobaculia bacterium]